MGNKEDVYNSNPFEHRRMILSNDEWYQAPIYPFAKSGFEPIDSTGRFAYYKSAAFKAYWDDASINKAYQLLQDGMYLDVFKPNFISGVSKIDGTVIAPGASIPLPKDATVSPYQLGPNLAAAMNVLNQNKDDLSESTQDQTQGGVVEPNVTARATVIAERNAKLILGVFGLMLANLIEQVGALAMDCVIQYSTVGQVDDATPETLKMRYKTFLMKGQEKGRQISNRVEFTDEFMGIPMSKEDKLEKEWGLYNASGDTNEERFESDQRVYKVNPYQFARMNYYLYVDADEIVSKSMGTDQERNMLAFQMMSNPAVAPFVDMKNVVEDFIVEPFSNGDPDRYLAKQQAGPNGLLAAAMGNNPGIPQPAGAIPTQQPALPATQAV